MSVEKACKNISSTKDIGKTHIFEKICKYRTEKLKFAYKFHYNFFKEHFCKTSETFLKSA
jgi:hypothetical protein